MKQMIPVLILIAAAGGSAHAGVAPHAVMADPEPLTLFLAGLACIGVGLCGRARKQPE